MKLSVLIPTLNEAERIVECLDSVQRLAAGWPGPLEVVVADGGSDDATRSMAASAGAIVVTCPPGRGNQLRLGANQSTGDVILMLHADTRLAAEASLQLAEALDDPQVGCGAFRQQIDAVGRRFRWLEAGNAFRVRRLGMPYGDQAIFVRRSLLEAVGGVPALPLMEDVALMRRLRKRAWPVLLPGPLLVSARRWEQNGVVRQTGQNWAFVVMYHLGVSPERLASWYRKTKTPSRDSQAVSSQDGEVAS